MQTLGSFKLLHEGSCCLTVRAREQPEDPLHVVRHLSGEAGSWATLVPTLSSPAPPTSGTTLLPLQAHLNVHSGCQGWLDNLTQREVSLLDSPVDNVIAVYCHNQADGQAHLLSNAPSLGQDRKTTGF